MHTLDMPRNLAAHIGPVIVSFYCGREYYYVAAHQLRQDCEHAGVDHDIVELDYGVAPDWITACRRKVSFCLEMHRKHQRPILWLDVDSRLAKRPDIFDGATCDIAGFLRGFRYLRDFDPQSSPRFFAPFALYFNTTPRATAFLEFMADLERRHEGAATDDFFLQEAWRQHRQQLSVLVLPPDLVGHEWPLRDAQTIYVGISGNVSKYKDRVQQHTAPIFAPAHRKALLLHEAGQAMKAGETDDGLLLYRRALAASPDDELANKIARLMRRSGRVAEAESFLRTYRNDTPTTECDQHSGKSFWQRWLPSRRCR